MNQYIEAGGWWTINDCLRPEYIQINTWQFSGLNTILISISGTEDGNKIMQIYTKYINR